MPLLARGCEMGYFATIGGCMMLLASSFSCGSVLVFEWWRPDKLAYIRARMRIHDRRTALHSLYRLRTTLHVDEHIAFLIAHINARNLCFCASMLKAPHSSNRRANIFMQGARPINPRQGVNQTVSMWSTFPEICCVHNPPLEIRSIPLHPDATP